MRASRASIRHIPACVEHDVCSVRTPANAQVHRLDLAVRNAFVALMFVQVFSYFEQPKWSKPCSVTGIFAGYNGRNMIILSVGIRKKSCRSYIYKVVTGWWAIEVSFSAAWHLVLKSYLWLGNMHDYLISANAGCRINASAWNDTVCTAS